jgi:hypothetical protein
VAGSNRHSPPDGSIGAYGFRILGVRAAPGQLVRAPAHWPTLELVVRVTAALAPAAEYVDDETAVLRLRSGGSVEIDRLSRRAVFHLPTQPDDRALIHPHLAGVAAVAAHWLGRESFHAGAFVAGGGVWGLLGDRGAGKSSLLASLALAGVPVVSDDVLVLDGRTALAGPRSIDLRSDAAAHLRAGEPLGVIGQRERWRLPLAPIAPEQPLRGWVVLGWDERTAVRHLQGSERLTSLLPHRAARLYPPQPQELIELSSLPFLQLRRRRCWDSADDALRRLLDGVEGA